MDALAPLVFRELDSLALVADWQQFPKIDIERVVLQKGKIVDLYKLLGSQIIDYTHNLKSIMLCRDICIGMLRDELNEAFIHSMTITKLGFGNCGELNQLVRLVFSRNISKIDGLLLECRVYESSSTHYAHAFSILVSREDTLQIKTASDNLKAKSNKSTIDELARIMPNAILIDAYFREFSELKNVPSRCERLIEYISEYNLDSIGIDRVHNSKDRTFIRTLMDCEKAASKLFVKLERQFRESARRVVVDSAEMRICQKLRQQDLMTRKFEICARFPTIDWKDSGSQLFGDAEKETVDAVCSILDRDRGSGKNIEYFRAPSQHHSGLDFITVNVDF